MDDFLELTAQVKDVVDVVSIVAYAVGDQTNKTLLQETGGLVELTNVAPVIKGLQQQGFRVEPLIGDFYGQNKIARYRRYYWCEGIANFTRACAAAVQKLHLSGLNFDWEPSDCETDATPCTESDARAFGALLSAARTAIRAAVPDARLSVDTGQSVIASTSILHAAQVDLLATMNTYYDVASFDIALPRDLARDGAARFSLGVCPSCSHSNASDVAHRMGAATSSGVRHLAYWAGARQDGGRGDISLVASHPEVEGLSAGDLISSRLSCSRQNLPTLLFQHSRIVSTEVSFFTSDHMTHDVA